MTNEIYPCLWFDGQAKEAAVFYCSVFDNSKVMMETPMMVGFELNGKKLMGLNGGPQYKINPSISMFVHCTSTEECERIWNSLSEDALVLMQLNNYPWSEKYGWLQDKFGFTWQIMKSDKDRMMPAMLFTGANFGRAKEAMDYYTKVFAKSRIDRVNYYPEGSGFDGKVTYSEIMLDDYPLVVMDGPNEHKFTFSEGVSLVVHCANQEEIDYFWNDFTKDGGEESRCGWCKDKFGVSWQIIPTNLGEILGNSQNGQRAFNAMLQMKKLIINDLINA
ncbi:MAG: VOC family protein [Saprospiraceae bacterium]